MAVLAWLMMGIAIWHFAIFLPDRYWGGIVGSFVFAGVGAVVVGFMLAGFQITGKSPEPIKREFLGLAAKVTEAELAAQDAQLEEQSKKSATATADDDEPLPGSGADLTPEDLVLKDEPKTPKSKRPRNRRHGR